MTDASTLAPDDGAQRARVLAAELDDAEAAVERAEREVQTLRAAEERMTADRKRRDAERSQKEAADRLRVREFLVAHGPATAAQVAAATGLTTTSVEWTARTLATRGRGGKLTIRPDALSNDQTDDDEVEPE